MKQKLRTNKHKVRKPKERPNRMLCFDGSKCKLGVSESIELVNSKRMSFYVTYQLQFRCTNNGAEYKALIRGLLFALEKGFAALIIEGDSQLVI